MTVVVKSKIKKLLLNTLLVMILVSALFSLMVVVYKRAISRYKLEAEADLKYLKTKLPVEKKKEYLNALLFSLETEKVYRDDSLSLQKLAEKINISSHHLSQMINDSLNQNFFDLINHYRVEEAKERLLETDDKILAVMYDVGFNTKGTFYRAFSKSTNMTPSEYRKANLK